MSALRISIVFTLIWTIGTGPVAAAHETEGERPQGRIGFPCNLDSFEKLPTITITGEIHGPEADKARIPFAEEAKQTKCYMTVEGVYCGNEAQLAVLHRRFGVTDPTAARLFGFDDPFTHGLGALLKFHTLIENAFQDKDERALFNNKYILTSIMRDNEFMREAWRQLRKKRTEFELINEEKIATFIDALFDNPDERVIDRLKDLSVEHPVIQGHRQFLSVLENWIDTYVSMAESDKYRESKLVPENLRKMSEEYFLDIRQGQTRDAILNEWRTQFIARNVAKQFCDAAAEGIENFRVFIGGLHVPVLDRLLSDWSDGKVTVVRAGVGARQEKKPGAQAESAAGGNTPLP